MATSIVRGEWVHILAARAFERPTANRVAAVMQRLFHQALRFAIAHRTWKDPRHGEFPGKPDDQSQTSLKKTTAGTVLVGEAGETLAEIVSSVKQVTEIIAAIAAASLEQAGGIDIGQVNDAGDTDG